MRTHGSSRELGRLIGKLIADDIREVEGWYVETGNDARSVEWIITDQDGEQRARGEVVLNVLQVHSIDAKDWLRLDVSRLRSIQHYSELAIDGQLDPEWMDAWDFDYEDGGLANRTFSA